MVMVAGGAEPAELDIVRVQIQVCGGTVMWHELSAKLRLEQSRKSTAAWEPSSLQLTLNHAAAHSALSCSGAWNTHVRMEVTCMKSEHWICVQSRDAL